MRRVHSRCLLIADTCTARGPRNCRAAPWAANEAGTSVIASGGPTGLWSSRARLHGYPAAPQAAGPGLDEALARRDCFPVAGVLGERGLRAPGDLSEAGFNDAPVAAWASPA
jgi:hypothetical protein